MSRANWPCIFPPGEMQNLIKCPGFLQLGHMLAHGGNNAGRAKVGMMVRSENSTLANVELVGDRLGNARLSGLCIASNS